MTILKHTGIKIDQTKLSKSRNCGIVPVNPEDNEKSKFCSSTLSSEKVKFLKLYSIESSMERYERQCFAFEKSYRNMGLISILSKHH